MWNKYFKLLILKAVCLVGFFYDAFGQKNQILSFNLKNNSSYTVREQSLAQTIEVLFYEDPADVKNYEKNTQARLDALKNGSKDHAEVMFHAAAVKLLQGQQTAGTLQMIKAYQGIKNQKDTQKLEGIFQVIFGMVPEQYNWVTKTLGFAGNQKVGIKILKAYESSGKEDSYEAFLFRFYTEVFLNTPENTLKSDVAELIHQAATYPLYGIMAAAAALRLNDADLAEEALSKIAHKSLPPIYERLMGDVSLYKLDAKKAILHYDKYLFKMQGTSFKKDVYLKKGFALCLLNQTSAARESFQKILQIKAAVHEKDKAAQRFASQGAAIPHAEILKGRLLFDGGSFKKSLEVLDKVVVDHLDLASQQEWYYRKARNYHLLDDLNKAKVYYSKCIEKSNKEEKVHFGASACLQMGFIYQKQNKVAEAKSFFVKAKSYKNNENGASISLRANQALKSL